MKIFKDVEWKVIKLLHKGRYNYNKLSNKRKEKLIEEEVQRFFYNLLGTKDISIGINFLDEIDFYIKEYKNHPTIKFKDREEILNFYSEVYGRYSTSVILQYFRLIMQYFIFDIYYTMTERPTYNVENKKVVVMPTSNLNTRMLAQINLAAFQHEISEEICKLYVDPAELISFAFPLISEFDYTDSYIKDFYVTNVIATQAVVKSVKAFLERSYLIHHVNTLFSTFLYCLMEYHNDVLVNYFDVEEQELIQLCLKNETLSVMFGILYEIEELNDADELNFGSLMKCQHPSVITDERIYNTLLDFRSSMIAMFISSLGSIAAAIKKTFTETEENVKTNVVDFTAKREMKDAVKDTTETYCLLAEDLINQLKSFKT